MKTDQTYRHPMLVNAQKIKENGIVFPRTPRCGFLCRKAHVDDEVVVVGIVARHAGKVLGESLAGLVDIIDKLGGSLLVKPLTLGDITDADILVSDKEKVYSSMPLWRTTS